jgi:hypothetical protein
MLFAEEKTVSPFEKLEKEAAQREALVLALSERGIPFEERQLFSEYGSFGASLHVFLPSHTRPNGETFVLAVPLSSGSQASFGMALDFIALIQNVDRPFDVRVAFLGDEGSSLPPDARKQAHMGLEDLCALLPERSVLWYVDLGDAPEKLVFAQGGERIVASLKMVRDVPNLCKEQGIPYRFAVSHTEFYHVGLADGPDVIKFAHERDIDALCVFGEPDSGGRPLSAEVPARLLAEYVSGLDFASESDDHYTIIVNSGGTVRFISEITFVLALIICASVFLLVFLVMSVVQRRILVLRWKIFFCYFWVALLLVIALTASLMVSGRIILFITRGTPLILSDYGIAALKIGVSLLLYSLIFSLFSLIRVPGKAYFLGNAAIVAGLSALLIAISFDITLLPTFAGAFVCVIVGSVGKMPLISGIASLMVPLQAAGFFIDLYDNGNKHLAEIVMGTGVGPMLITAIMLLPMILILEREVVLIERYASKKSRALWKLIIKKPDKTKHPVASFTRTGFFIRIGSLAVFLMIGVYFLSLYINRPENIPSPPVRRFVEQAPAKQTFGGAAEDGQIPAGQFPLRQILGIAHQENVFLERTVHGFTLKAEGRPARFDLYLSSKDGSVPDLYSASMPFKEDNGRLEFILGENPPNPFTCEIILSKDFAGTLSARAVYAAYDPSIDGDAAPKSRDYVFTVTIEEEIGNK